ncbi:TniQ family protein [Oculatella sp. FACHB-28]|uniref:TniQ family protein n=1 Tax=Oculatella sp. FACHB-28 TaxID=2692845 RepID=UPI0018EF618A|nr:TniQ family protein [Oculatella sp. FACHB-28]
MVEQMEDGEVQRSLLYLPPYEGESISHYLGRWFRQEVVQADAFSVGGKLRLGKILHRCENFYLNPRPTSTDMTKLGKLIDLEIERLMQMFPPEDEMIDPRPIRLCAACYGEAPYHRTQWQWQSVDRCDRHHLILLTKCSGHKCGAHFLIPSKWRSGKCQQCGMSYRKMAKHQKSY